MRKRNKEFSGLNKLIGFIRNFLFERDVKRDMPKSDKAILEKARRIQAEREHEQKVARARDKIRLDNRFKGIDDNYDEDGEALIGWLDGKIGKSFVVFLIIHQHDLHISTMLWLVDLMNNKKIKSEVKEWKKATVCLAKNVVEYQLGLDYMRVNAVENVLRKKTN